MAERFGTIIAAEVTAATDQETFAYTDANFLRGGAHQYATLAERDAIPPDRRREFMQVTVLEDGPAEWWLVGGMTNSHWRKKQTPGNSTVTTADVVADGASPTLTVTHNLNRRNIIVSFMDITAMPHDPVTVDWEYIDDNAIRLLPATILTAGRTIRAFIN
jgi:hypothetical protein